MNSLKTQEGAEPSLSEIERPDETEDSEDVEHYNLLDDLSLIGGAAWTSIRRTLSNETSIRDVQTKSGVELKMSEDYPADDFDKQDDHLETLAERMEEVADEIEKAPGDEGWRDMVHFGARINDDLAWMGGRPGLLAVGTGLMLNTPKSFEFGEAYANSFLPYSEGVESVLDASSETLNYNLAETVQMEGFELFGSNPFEEVSPLYILSLGVGAYVFDKGLNGVNNYWKKLENFTENQEEIAEVYREAAEELRNEGEISNGSPQEVYKDRRTPLLLGHIHRKYDEGEDVWERLDPEDKGTFGLLKEGGMKASRSVSGRAKPEDDYEE